MFPIEWLISCRTWLCSWWIRLRKRRRVGAWLLRWRVWEKERSWQRCRCSMKTWYWFQLRDKATHRRCRRWMLLEIDNECDERYRRCSIEGHSAWGYIHNTHLHISICKISVQSLAVMICVCSGPSTLAFPAGNVCRWCKSEVSLWWSGKGKRFARLQRQ